VSPNPLSDRFERLAQAIAERVVNLVIDAIDINAVVERVDLDQLIGKVDINQLVAKVDIEQLIERVDVDALIQSVDVDALVRRVNLNAIVSQLDIDSLVEQTELGSIIAKSTTGVLTQVLDLVRSQGVGLDDFVARWTNRILHRKSATLPIGPPMLVARPAPAALPAAGHTEVR
jgi:ATP-dependent protease Clp ATPase subunit